MKNIQVTIHNAAKREAVITEALNELKRNDYKLKFRREATCLYCCELQEWIMPEDFTVDKFYHFEETLNPGAGRMLYAISVSQSIKGFLIDTCNVYADNISIEMAQKLKYYIPQKHTSHKYEKL